MRPLAVFILFVCAAIGGPSLVGRAQSQDLVGVYLTWKSDPATTMTVNWVDLFEGSSRSVWYRRQG
ncbi:MAG: hypothetical protein EBZ36_05860, partial [Acidobacteria bacterium]|nr:hypothetical protein [Acidobacteriota bacterium]